MTVLDYFEVLRRRREDETWSDSLGSDEEIEEEIAHKQAMEELLQDIPDNMLEPFIREMKYGE